MEKKTHNLFIIANISAFFRSYMHKIRHNTFLRTQNRLKNRNSLHSATHQFCVSGRKKFQMP